MHPATRALRSTSPEHFRDDLLTVLVESERGWLRDTRDLMVMLAPFHDCARRLGLDVAAEFAAVAAQAPPSLRETVERFGARTDVDERTFCFEVAETPEGPDYRMTFGRGASSRSA